MPEVKELGRSMEMETLMPRQRAMAALKQTPRLDKDTAERQMGCGMRSANPRQQEANAKGKDSCIG